MRHVGLTGFARVKPRGWVVASFERHAGPHGIQHRHVRDIVVTALTTQG